MKVPRAKNNNNNNEIILIIINDLPVLGEKFIKRG